jgi:hypothetical protein
VDVAQLLWEAPHRPDRRTGVLVVIGHQVLPQLYDGVAAARLRDAINRRGDAARHERAYIVADAGLSANPEFMECPLIALGGGVSNGVTRDLERCLAADPISTERVRIQHDLAGGGRRVLLHGPRGPDTADAVDLFIGSGLLDRFLGRLWGRKVAEPPGLNAPAETAVTAHAGPAGPEPPDTRTNARFSDAETDALWLLRNSLKAVTLATIAKRLGWSLAQASKTVRGLLDRGYLVHFNAESKTWDNPKACYHTVPSRRREIDAHLGG